MARILTAFAAVMGLACAVWPRWTRVPQDDSGLVGEWAGQPTWSGGDTIVWHFDSAGTAARSRVRWRRNHDRRELTETRESFGHWRTYTAATHAAQRFVCFDYGRERARLPCWYFTIESVDGSRRALKLLGQVGESPRPPDVYWLVAGPAPQQ